MPALPATPLPEPPVVLPSPAAPPSRGYAYYVLALLTVVYAFNYLDRQLLSILLVPVQKEFGASDTVMGLLTGPVFAIVYACVGIPVARLADLFGRRTVIAVALAAWSAMTAVTSWAKTLPQLVLARIGVGLGESGGTPPSFALISDYFPPERRATALGLFALGVPLGTFLGNTLGGWIGQAYSWREAFVWLGLPGMLIAAVMMLTVREPRRGGFDPEPAHPPSGADSSFAAVFRHLLASPTFLWLIPAVSFAAFAGYGFGMWKPAFLMRVHDFSLRQAGTWVGIVNSLTGIAASVLAGVLADRLGRISPRWPLRMAAISVALALPFQLAFLFWPNPYVALLVVAPAGIIGGLWPPPTYACAQNLVPAHMRALATAILLFFLNLIGMGAGPLAVGFLSDVFGQRFGDESVRYALALVVCANALAAFSYWRASRSYADAGR